jgi:flagellar biogenesis protein FliO
VRHLRPHLLLVALLIVASVDVAQAQAPEAATAPSTLIRTNIARPAAAETSGNLDIPRVVGSLAIVIAAIFALRWTARRFFHFPAAGRSSDLIEILARTPISGRQHVVILKIARRVLVVADNGQQLTTLCEITDPQELRELETRTTETTEEPKSLELQGLLTRVRGLAQQFK